MCSRHPLALLYKSLLSLGKVLSLTIIPLILKEAALLIIDPIFLGSETSSNAAKVIFVSFVFMSTYSFILLFLYINSSIR